jgi:hypothetical protein
MSTSPDVSRHAADRLVNAISHWLAGHLRDDELRAELELVGTGELGPEQREAVEELLTELRERTGSQGELEMVARETLQTLVFGA